jgi:tRNA A58 N-methylase Trm61
MRKHEDEGWLAREGERRMREAAANAGEEILARHNAEIRAQRNDLADALEAMDVEVVFLELRKPDEELDRAFEDIVKFFD